ncbi:FadR family transcriptional regulator [Clostridium sp. 2-1]|uniref:FadR/GntR family transcriptional regulator n=1 Tax=Clostridium TaxID=1485 RepID=UPI000CDA9C8B|nr:MULTISPECIES: FadR/GntR family transcriptional regulator [Clostridium]MBN7576240.1 FadR family transcriptional regulator [Clostridium beijerinckii]MBN7581304.1 FadR family transcriptional regulator [Clostridium beijerinckii]MBN7586009.1 FadR family transcriptional regulator [Clostridium beijerinckii]MBO0521924.1 FadR family transcriptional regulator [Clostridium beijerinckii]POO90039.1 FadR family transcriptional regulator [Clostridium sp. 2-1]
MLSPVKSTKIYEIVIEQIKEIVKRGELKSGDKLPSERDLCEKLEVSRASVREALKSLQMLGLIESKHGEGNFINEKFENSLLEPLSIVFLLLGSKSEDVLELRKIIEPETAAIAAKNITDEQLIELKEIMGELNNNSDIEACAILDKKFHYKIAQATGNHLISTIMFSISSLVEKYIENSKVHTINKILVKNHHEEIWRALKDHDSNAASIAAQKHLELSHIV